ncbi:ATP-binding protein [Pseudomonas sp. UBA6323]|uniref:AAA family ATPase n=1 Tax=Pseudomonas sp. UBA6323 TaxID=1947329 RepID=UPI0025D9E2DB|nr:AAA family ATPase [Pseudomonas sp. UBA6323]
MTAPSDRFAKEWEGVSVLPRPAGAPAWRANLVSAATITPKAAQWLWPQWLPRGMLTILAGAGGDGKTTLTLGLIATMTSGGRWPDGTHCSEKQNAVIFSSEDSAEHTIIPRLIAAGADLSRVFIMQGRINDLGEQEPFDPSRDCDLLARELERIGGAGLIMIDPIVAAVSGDMHRANDVRRSLQPLVNLAEQHGAAVVGISHFSKGSQASSPAERVLGSQAFTALARMVLVSAKREGEEDRVLARAKSNISADDGGCTYMIEPTTIDGGIATVRATWGDVIDGSAREILADVEQLNLNDEPDEDDPAEVLRRVLSAGRLDGKEAKRVMANNGFSAKQVRSAREKLAVDIVREGFGKEIVSYWSLPAFVPRSPFVPSENHSCPLSGEGTNGEKGHEWAGEPPSLSNHPAPPAFDESDSEAL